MPLGFVPCNVIPEEILTDHPARFRAVLVDSANPLHSLADSATFAEAFAALDLLVVVDVALTETARAAHWVLPAASQFEKWEATFFNLEFPHNTFQLRAPLLDPLPGTLAEPEIYARLVEAVGGVRRWQLALLYRAARLGRRPYLAAFAGLAATDKRALGLAPYLLYRTLGPTLPDGAAGAAALWGLALRVAREHRAGMRRAGHRNHDELFDALLRERSGVVFTHDEPEHAWDNTGPAQRRSRRLDVAVPGMLSALAELDAGPVRHTSADFPLVLMAGQRRSFSANTIFRTPQWRLREPHGSLRVSPADADSLGLLGGGRARVVTARGAAEAVVEEDDRLRAGHVALPNGFGLDLVQPDGTLVRDGVRANDLTDVRQRDPITGNPWHKHVPARVEAV